MSLSRQREAHQVGGATDETPASVISSPADHQLRSVTSDSAAPTRKSATNEITALHAPTNRTSPSGAAAPLPEGVP
jgi:hypothetical protein